MRFNSPPNWPPPPPGFVPGPQWRPDPRWGPAPPGWQFWVPDGGPSGKGRRAMLIAAVAAVVLVLVVTVGVTTKAYRVVTDVFMSNEALIERTTEEYFDAATKNDVRAMNELTCASVVEAQESAIAAASSAVASLDPSVVAGIQRLETEARKFVTGFEGVTGSITLQSVDDIKFNSSEDYAGAQVTYHIRIEASEDIVMFGVTVPASELNKDETETEPMFYRKEGGDWKLCAQAEND